MSLNKVTLIGNLGQDPEIRSTGDGREIASFSVATTESWKDKNTGEKSLCKLENGLTKTVLINTQLKLLCKIIILI
jgi:hypothetical protein